MRERGIGRRRRVAVAAILVALSVAAPELASPAGAASTRPAGRTEMQSRSAARDTRVAKRRKRRRRRLSGAQRKGKLAQYLRQHPTVLAQHLRASGAKIRPAALRKNPALVRAYLKQHPKKKLGTKGKFMLKKGAKKLAPKGAKPAKHGAKTGKAALASAKKKNGTKGHPLGLTGWGEIALLAMLPLLAVGALLFITDRLRQPPAPPTPKRRRRTLVITPLSRNR